MKLNPDVSIFPAEEWFHDNFISWFPAIYFTLFLSAYLVYCNFSFGLNILLSKLIEEQQKEFI